MIGKKLKTAFGRTAVVLLILTAVAACCLLPQFAARLFAESKNRTVTLSLLYSDLKNRVSDVGERLDEFREAGVTSVTLPEDSVSSLAARGEAVSLRYRDVIWRFDDEWEDIGKLLRDVDGIEYGSHIVAVSDPKVAARLDLWLPLYYSEAECINAGAAGDVSVYVFFDGNREDYDLPVGYDEDALALITSHGLSPALSMRVGSHTATGYIDMTGVLIERYGVRDFVLKKDSFSRDTDKYADENADGIANLIKKHSLTLVVSENASQLSNEECIGYDTIFDAAEGRVMRSFETYDCSNPDSTGYMFRYMQYLNSVTDRNIRFVTVTQLALGGKSNERLVDDTAAAVRVTAGKLSSLGYDVGGRPEAFDYSTHTYVYALAAVFAVSAGLAALSAVFDVRSVRATIAALILAAAAFGLSFAMPRPLLLLYPTATALAIPCLAVSLSLLFVRRFREKLGVPLLIIGYVLVTLAVTSVGGAVMASLTSGLDYYINNDIFRGIKLTLYAPLLFAALSYYVMFVHMPGSFSDDIGKALGARVRVWWCAVAAVLGGVSFIYILRSGNVSSISRAEELMRNFITEHIAARPRTKEFLAAYPCAVLFAWYAKKTRANTFTWILAVGAAILPASITNTFCHVFTDVRIQYGRVAAGLALGIVTSAAVLILNHAIVSILKRAAKKRADRASENTPEA